MSASAYRVKKTPGARLTPEQIARLTQLFRQLDAAEVEYDKPHGIQIRPTEDDALSRWFKSREGILTATDPKGDILGFAEVHRTPGYKNVGSFGALVVDKDKRGLGIGRALLQKALRDNRRRRWKTMLRVSLNNQAGQSLYASEGFVPTGQTMVASEKKAEAKTPPDAYCKNLGRCRRKGFNLYQCDHKCICKNGVWMRGDQV